MIKIFKKNNKAISVFDSVRFITSISKNRFKINLFEGLEDYKIVLTHGVIGELIELIEQNNFFIPKKNIHILANNIETQKLFSSLGYNVYCISEYIFTDEDRYVILNVGKEYDCIFPGRESKSYKLFETEFKSNINILYKNKNFPFPHDNMVELYNKSCTGLMTTHSEGSCLSVGEMLLCGIPVVSVKIDNTISREKLYPINKKSYKNTYQVVLPNTLGGRELWLSNENSVYCKRYDGSIDSAIQELKSKNLNPFIIREQFLGKLEYHRISFLFLLKSLLEDLGFNFNEVNISDFINLPYGNSSISSSGWLNTIKHFESSYTL